jgi:hypothetical protein
MQLHVAVQVQAFAVTLIVQLVGSGVQERLCVCECVSILSQFGVREVGQEVLCRGFLVCVCIMVRE